MAMRPLVMTLATAGVIVGLASCKVDVSASLDTTVDASPAPAVDSGARAEAAPPVEVPDAGSDAGDASDACPRLTNALDVADPGWIPDTTASSTLAYVTTADGKYLHAHTPANTTPTDLPTFPNATRAQVKSGRFSPPGKIVCKLKVRPGSTAPATYDVFGLEVGLQGDVQPLRYRAGYYKSQLFVEIDRIDELGSCKQCPIPTKVTIATSPSLSPAWQEIEVSIDGKGMTARDGSQSVSVAFDTPSAAESFQVRAGIGNLDTVPQDADFDDLVCTLGDC